MQPVAVLILLFPLLGFFINGLGGIKRSEKVIGIIGCGSVGASFLLSIYYFIVSLRYKSFQEKIDLYPWITGGLHIDFTLWVDPLTVVMLLVVTGVGFLIHVYSVGYMAGDDGFWRFFAFLNLFVFFMLLLVMAGSFAVMFIGWEGVGLCSYLLIGFWWKNRQYTAAANKAFIMNRIGDLGFLLGMFLLFQLFGTTDFQVVFSRAALMPLNDPSLIAATLLLFVGAVGKSAQIPLFTWLPDAMAGPTPVSALIHAATMVTAGVYMVVRAHALYTLAPMVLTIIAWIGAITALGAALVALTQTDIKKVLAYSTISQLGYMFAATGVTAFSSGMFHLVTHAFFKALLFLGAGSVIHALHHEQDLRRMGGLRHWLPITYGTMLIGTLAISGMPPLAGFFSKDEILVSVFDRSWMLFVLLLLTSVLTAAYMFRLFFLAFFGNPRMGKGQEVHESPRIMTLPLIVLALFSATAGFLGIPLLFGELHGLNRYLEPVFAANPRVLPPEHHVAVEIQLMLASALVALGVGYWMYQRYAIKPVMIDQEQSVKKWWYRWSYRKFYVDELYERMVVWPVEKLGDYFRNRVEPRIIDAAVNGLGAGAVAVGRQLGRLQTGFISTYVLWMVLGLVVLLAIAIYSIIQF